MAQLLFEPSAVKIGDDEWLVVPKNNEDIIDVNEDSTSESDIRQGHYKCCMHCSTIVKDIILAMWGEPVEENGVLKAHIHSEAIADKITEAYEGVWLPDENNKYTITTGATTIEKDTLLETVTTLVHCVKNTLQAEQNRGQDNDDSSGD